MIRILPECQGAIPLLKQQALHAKRDFMVTAWLSRSDFAAQSRNKVHIQEETGQSAYG